VSGRERAEVNGAVQNESVDAMEVCGLGGRRSAVVSGRDVMVVVGGWAL